MKINPDFVSNLKLAAVLLGLMVLATAFIGIGKGGFSFENIGEQVQFNFTTFQFLFYVVFGVSLLFGILVIYLIETAITTGDDKYGSSICFNSPGEIPAFNFKFLKNPYILIFGSIIISIIFGLFATVTHQTFTGVGVLAQQFTLTDNLLYSGLLIPAAENIGVAFSFALAFLFFRQFARNVKMSRVSFMILTFLIAIIVYGFYGFAMHQLLYGASEISILSSTIFWMSMGILTVATGSFISGWVLHIANNLFFNLTENFSNEIILSNSIIAVIVLVVIFVIVFVRRKK